MSSIAIVVGFAVMLFLPCAIALMGGREPKRKQTEEFSAYSDRVVNAVVKPVPPVIEGAPIARTNALAPLGSIRPDHEAPFSVREMPEGTRDLAVHGRDAVMAFQPAEAGVRDLSGIHREPTWDPHQQGRDLHLGRETQMHERERETYGREPLMKYLDRVEQAELEVAKARAVAARAQADALAAVARAAILQAEAAAAEAEELEDDASDGVREGRRAA